MSGRAKWMDLPHEPREGVADGSFCRCGMLPEFHHLIETTAAAPVSGVAARAKGVGL